MDLYFPFCNLLFLLWQAACQTVMAENLLCLLAWYKIVFIIIENKSTNLLFFQIGIAGSYLLWAVADSFPLFVLARAAGGISKANVSLATAIMADITDAATRAKAMVL